MESIISLNELTNFIYKTKDLYSLVQKVYYKDMTNSIYNYYLKKLNNNKTLDEFFHYGFMLYKDLNKLNNVLNITDSDIDNKLIEEIVDLFYTKYFESNELKQIQKKEFINSLKERIVFNYTVINNIQSNTLKLKL